MFDTDLNDEELQPELTDDGGTPEGGEAARPKDEVAEALKEVRGELKSLRTRLSESEADARFWREQARGGGQPADEAEEEDEEPQVSDDLLEAFSSGDAKRVTKVLKEMGFTREKDVQRAIGATRQEITQQGQLYQEYPELADQNSDFFQATAKQYNALVAKDPSLKKSAATIEIAAKLAKAEMGEPDTRRPRRGRDVEDFEEDDDAEFERARRVASQAGERGRPRSNGGGRSRGAGEDGDLTSIQRGIIAKFQAAGSQVTEDGYRKRAQSGVRMSGIGRGGRR